MENNIANMTPLDDQDIIIEHVLTDVISKIVVDMIQVRDGKMTIDDLIGKWSSNGVCQEVNYDNM